MPIVEAGLDELVREGLDGGRLSFVLGAARGGGRLRVRLPVRATPQGDDGSADLSYIRSVAAEIGPAAARRGHRDQQVDRAGRARPGWSSRSSAATTCASCPTPSSSGRARPCTTACTPTASSSAPTTRPPPSGWRRCSSRCGPRCIVTDPASAETIKYASNAFLATKVSFVNAIANVCEAVGADVRDVLLGMGYDKRIGFEFLKPGPGLGRVVLPEGHRRPHPHRRGRRLRLRPPPGRHRGQRRAVRAGGRQGRARRPAARSTGVTVAVWGLTFKARTDDLRESPALEVIGRLLARGARVQAYDPAIAPRRRRPRARRASRCAPTPTPPARAPRCWSCSPSGTSSGGLDFAKVAGLLLRPPRVVDARNLLDPAAAAPARLQLRRDRPVVAGRRVVVTGGRRVPRLAPVRGAARPGRRGGGHRQPAHRRARQHRPTSSASPAFTFLHHDVSNYVHVPGPVDAVLHFASPASPVDYLDASRSRPSRSAASAPTTPSAWPRTRAPASCWPRPARSTATPWSTPRPRTTGATSTRSAPGASTTRPSASPRR